MKCVHSIWTGTARFTPRRGPMLIHALSACYAARHFETTEIVTDDRGLSLVETLGIEYTSALTSLQYAMTNPGTSHIWALGKLYAILEQKTPFVQIDTDVILRKPLNPRLLRSRVFAQSMDFPDFYRGKDMADAIRVSGLPGNHTAYNCGVIGGTDVFLLHEYARRVIALAKRFDGCPINGTTTSMVLEQYQLGVVAREAGVRVETVLPLRPRTEQVKEAGYVHLQGHWKHDAGWIARCEARFKKEFPAAYKRFLAGWAHVEANTPWAGGPVADGGSWN